MPGMKWFVASLLGALSCAAVADQPFMGPQTFPQFRDMSGLPGSAFGVDASGNPTIDGAMAISTPIGFALGHNRFAFGVASRSYDGNFKGINIRKRSGTAGSDGSAQGMVGITTPAGNLTISGLLLSSVLDSVGNLQLQLPFRSEDYGISVGVQNVMNRGEASGEGYSSDKNLSRSCFVVGTYRVAKGAYVSLGKGDVRFKGVFGSGCFSPLPRTKVTSEYDGYGWNSGIGYSLGKVAGLPSFLDRNDITLFAGYIQEKKAFLALNFTF